MSQRHRFHPVSVPSARPKPLVSPRWWIGVVALVSLLLCSTVRGQVFDERFEDWPIDLKIGGRVAAVGQLADLAHLQPLFVDVPDPSRCLVVCDADKAPAVMLAYQELFADVTRCTIEELIGRSVETIPATIALQTTAIADQHLPAAGKVFRRLSASGHTIISAGAAATLLGKHSLADNGQQAEGLNLLPDCILRLDFHIADQPMLINALQAHPRSVGMGLHSPAAVVLEGRKLQVAGAGSLTLLVNASEHLPQRSETIVARATPDQRTTEWLADLTQWRREAIERTLEPFPAAHPAEPRLKSGTLLIVGGGSMPEGLMQRFVDLAGGSETARLVYIPCAEEDQVSEQQPTIWQWHKMGVKHATVLHTKDRRQANEDQHFLEPLKTATGIWFGGGRQWNFADSYYGTQAHRLMKQVLERGGVVGGSSAGASIQARYLARATPIENTRIMAPGYERGGLGFLSGVAIDQHFSQRNRLRDMSQLVARYPQLLGIGIDEATGIEVQGSRASIVGAGKVFFYDGRQSTAHSRDDFTAGVAGQVYDLVDRKFK